MAKQLIIIFLFAITFCGAKKNIYIKQKKSVTVHQTLVCCGSSGVFNQITGYVKVGIYAMVHYWIVIFH